MSITRRQFNTCLSAGTAALAAPASLLAQTTKPLRVLVGYAAGGAADNVARSVGEGMRDSGYTFIVDNKAGAAGRLAPEALLAAPADGNTLLLAPLSNITIYRHIYKTLKYDPLKDLVPLATAGSMSFGLAVSANSPAKTLQEYLALAKNDSNLAIYGTPGAGTPMHFMGAMLGRKTGLPLVHVPYRGGAAAVTDTIGGTLPAVISTLPNLLTMHRAGKLRILAISNPEPIAALPGVSTFKSAGFPELTMSEVFGFFIRSGTAAPVVAQLNAAISAAVKSPKVSGLLGKVEIEPRVMTSAAMAQQVRAEYDAWANVVKATGYSQED